MTPAFRGGSSKHYGLAIPYGVPVCATSLANTAMDGGNAHVYANDYRFQCPTTSSLTSLQMYWQGFLGTSGYGGGTGGTARMIICPDDGTANHLPVPGTVLYQVDCTKTGGTGISFVGGNPFFTTYTISPSVPMVSGSIYHCYFRDVDATPATNFVSVDMIIWTPASPSDGGVSNGTNTPFAPGGSYNTWAHLYQGSNGGAWTLRDGYSPVLTLTYANGVVYGHGYMEVATARGVGPTIASQVREVITPAITRCVNGVRVPFLGSGTPTCRFQVSDGTLIDQGAMSADPVYGTASGWNYQILTFGAPRLMTAGLTYHVVLTATSGSLTVVPVRKGSVEYSFAPAACFQDGYMQYSTTGVSTTSFGTPVDPFVPHECDVGGLLFF